MFTLAIPKKKGSKKACFFLCKYLIQNTFYANINCFIKEMQKILNVLLFKNKEKQFIIISTNQVYFLNIKQNLICKNIYFFSKNNINFPKNKTILKQSSFLI